MRKEHKARVFVKFALVLIAIVISFNFALESSFITPQQESCQDWDFHLCFAETGDAKACSQSLNLPERFFDGCVEKGKSLEECKAEYEGYNYYSGCAHALAGFVSENTGLSLNVVLSFILAACIGFLAFLLLFESGFTAFFLFFFVFPLVFIGVFWLLGVTTVNPFFWWFSLQCGTLSFMLAVVFFLALFCCWRKHSTLKIASLAFLASIVHAYGFVLVLFWVVCTFASLILKRNVDLEAAVLLIFLFSVSLVFPDGLRVLYVFYFFLAMLLGREFGSYFENKR